MKYFKDEIGKTYNYLTVETKESPVTNSKGYNSRRWGFRCVCGELKIINPSNVFSGSTKSCGCKKKELTKNGIIKYYNIKHKNSVEKRLYQGYKSDSKRNNRDFLLKFKDFVRLFNSNCYFCGDKPNTLRFNKTKSKSKLLNGVDRLDSTKGYTKDNVVSCCSDCNYAKRIKSIDNFMSWVKRIYEFNFI